MKAFAMMLIMTAALISSFPAWCDEGPEGQIQETVENVIETLKDESITGDEQREKLTSLIKERFDFEAMSQWVLGPYWKKATSQEQERFKELFSELLEASYLGRIENYSNEKVEFLEEKVDGRRSEVETLIVKQGADIPITYKLVARGEQWLVYDVIIEKVSLVRNYRGTYTEIARRDGMDALFEQMRQKISELKRQKEARSAE